MSYILFELLWILYTTALSAVAASTKKKKKKKTPSFLNMLNQWQTKLTTFSTLQHHHRLLQ